MLLNFISSSFLICVSGFNVTSTKELGTLVPFMTFLVMSCTQIALLCYCGDMVVKTSGDLSEAAYKCLWYEMDVGFKRTIFILIQRSQRPCRITAANFAVLNLTAFTTVVSRSWSYFALLKTMYN
uniref:Putative odorant receptor 11 n=1 Tax=Conopomorpha sinensis TaxID=940481 RepID=A0A3Q8HD94_9NEOP|nr:putative odorant receptor 11 [Conopomorpha sinensis]